MVALIPARAGSKRVPGKNTKLLAGRPLIDYTLTAAKASGVFRTIWVCTDDQAAYYAAARMGIFTVLRDTVPDGQADIEWVREALTDRQRHEAFAILRPTSPFRTAETIRRAFAQFTLPDQTADSIRAVEPVKQHPGKMWALNSGVITPLLDYKRSDGVPWHSCPTQTLPTFYVQNSSLEMAWTANVEVHGTIHGRKVAPFLTQGYEGFSIDYPEDWERAEALIASGAVSLPTIQSHEPGTTGPSHLGQTTSASTAQTMWNTRLHGAQ